jgi:hypothetical protein
VDGRDKPGHDEKANHFHAVRKSLKILTSFSVRLSGCGREKTFGAPKSIALKTSAGVSRQRP